MRVVPDSEDCAHYRVGQAMMECDSPICTLPPLGRSLAQIVAVVLSCAARMQSVSVCASSGLTICLLLQAVVHASTQTLP